MKQNKDNTIKLFEIPTYPTTNAGTDSKSRYDIWDGDIKPNGYIYMIVTEEKSTIINFFDNKKEALSWMKNTV